MNKFLKQWVAAFALLVATHNPTNWSYLGWLDYRPELPASLVLLVGFLLSMGYVWYIRTSLQTIGRSGISILYLFFFLLLWTLADFQLVRLDTDPALLWFFLVVTAFIFAVGVTWIDLRKIRFRLRNQFKPKQELCDEWDF